MSYSDPLNSTKPCAKKQASTHVGTCLSRAGAGRFQLEGSNIVELEFPPTLLTANEVSQALGASAVTLESFLAHRATGAAESETATGGVGRVIWRHWGKPGALPMSPTGFR
jgi:hypothetical protein